MRMFAAISGVFLGAILLIIGYATAYFHGDAGYVAPLWFAVVATIGLPIAFFLKARRDLPMSISRLLFTGMVVALGVLWFPLVKSSAMRGEHLAPMIAFSAIWLVASMPLLRAGIRHRP